MTIKISPIVLEERIIELEFENNRLRALLIEKKVDHTKSEQEALFDSLIQNIPFGFWAFDSHNICFIQNKVSKQLLGDITGKSIELYRNKNNKLIDSCLSKIIDVFDGKDVQYELKTKIENDKIVYFQNVLSPIKINNEIKGILVFNIDISDRKLFEHALQDSEKKFRKIYNNSTDAIVIHNYNGIIHDYNEEFRSITGWTHKDLLVKANFYEMCSADQRNTITKSIQSIKNDEQVFNIETEISDIVGLKIPVEIKSKIIQYGESTLVLSIVQNLSLRKRFEQKLLNTVVETEEKERNRLAVDLHDEIGPLLSSMKMYLSLIKDTKDEEKTLHITSHVMELVKQSITSIREISNSLSPHLLSNFGLVAAFNNTIAIAKDLILVKFTTNCNNIRFPNNIEIVYYRIFKELLNNTLKHANANQIELSLQYNKKVLSLKLKDNGKGFSVLEQMEERKTGLGLFNILSRVKAINGDYHLTSEKGKGVDFELNTKIEPIK
jgi:PAS domain S-box-containing protein